MEPTGRGKYGGLPKPTACIAKDKIVGGGKRETSSVTSGNMMNGCSLFFRRLSMLMSAYSTSITQVHILHN